CWAPGCRKQRGGFLLSSPRVRRVIVGSVRARRRQSASALIRDGVAAVCAPLVQPLDVAEADQRQEPHRHLVLGGTSAYGGAGYGKRYGGACNKHRPGRGQNTEGLPRCAQRF